VVGVEKMAASVVEGRVVVVEKAIMAAAAIDKERWVEDRVRKQAVADLVVREKMVI